MKILNDKWYNVLKWLSLIAIDAVGVFYRTISEIWGLPYGNAILATCSAVSVLIGTLIGASTIVYNKAKQENKELTDGEN